MNRPPLTLCSLLTAALQLAAVPAAGQTATIAATVDRNQARVGEQIRLQVSVVGGASVKPILPDLPDFEVYGQGTTTQMSLVNGRMSTSVIHSYVLVPNRVGNFTVGSILVEQRGTTLASRPFTLRILASDSEPKEAQRFFLRASVSNDKPVVGEPVTYSLRFFNRAKLANGTISEPDFSSLVKQSLGDKRSYETVLAGVAYQVTEFRWALMAQRPGQLTIPPATVTCEVILAKRQRPFDAVFDDAFSDFFGRRETQTRVVRSDAIELNVQPLPSPPEGFSGLVGSFTVETALSQRQVHVGESVTLTVKIAGRGNAAAIGEPTLSGLDAFKVYDDKPVIDVAAEWEGLRGSKTFKRALVPLATGELTLPPVMLSYFDPTVGIYKTARSPALSLTALPPTGKEELRLTEMVTAEAGKVSVRVLSNDILPIYRPLDALAQYRVGRTHRFAFGAAMVTPAMAFAGFALWRGRRERWQLDVAGRRSREAKKRARAVARQALRKKTQREAAVALAARALRLYVGDKLNREGGALTPVELAAELAALGVDEGLTGQVRTLVEQADALRYGAVASALPDQPGQQALALIDRLEVALGRARHRPGGTS